MDELLEKLKEVKTKTIERLIEKHGTIAGSDLSKEMLSIWDVRNVIYEVIDKIATIHFKTTF